MLSESKQCLAISGSVFAGLLFYNFLAKRSFIRDLRGLSVNPAELLPPGRIFSRRYLTGYRDLRREHLRKLFCRFIMFETASLARDEWYRKKIQQGKPLPEVLNYKPPSSPSFSPPPPPPSPPPRSPSVYRSPPPLPTSSPKSPPKSSLSTNLLPPYLVFTLSQPPELWWDGAYPDLWDKTKQKIVNWAYIVPRTYVRATNRYNRFYSSKILPYLTRGQQRFETFADFGYPQ
eukprot:750343-Hanusia_phi.AAC.2